MTLLRRSFGFVSLLIVMLAAPLLKAEALTINAHSAILLDMTNGKILFSQNAESAIPPASITKILSLYLADEAIREGKVSVADPVKISRRAGRTGGSKMFILPGSEIPLEELLKGMAVVSANDASVAVAEHLAGDVDAFVELMNQKAKELGMTKSYFRNPNGLPAKGQTTTARDVLILAREYLREFPESLNIHSQQYFTYRHITQHNRNALLKTYPDVDGLKTGWIHQSGYHIIATARRGGTRLIAVVMGAKNPKTRNREAERLLDQGFHLVAEGQQRG